MSVSTYAQLFVGAFLSETQAMEIWGVKYTAEIVTKCPSCNASNPSKKKYCSECGTSCTVKRKTSEGAENIFDLDIRHIFSEVPLSIEVLLKQTNGVSGVLIGKRIIHSKDINCSGSLQIIEDNLKEVASQVEETLSKMGIKTPVKAYFITSVSF
jgi:hypothetical protein